MYIVSGPATWNFLKMFSSKKTWTMDEKYVSPIWHRVSMRRTYREKWYANIAPCIAAHVHAQYKHAHESRFSFYCPSDCASVTGSRTVKIVAHQQSLRCTPICHRVIASMISSLILEKRSSKSHSERNLQFDSTDNFTARLINQMVSLVRSQEVTSSSRRRRPEAVLAGIPARRLP